jgi:hypothetical protein
MRKLPLIVLTLGVLAFISGHADAARITVQLTQNQVNTVCNGKNYCQKPCGSNKQYNCEFGCGSSGCGGTCLTCPTGQARIQPSKSAVKGAVAVARWHRWIGGY